MSTNNFAAIALQKNQQLEARIAAQRDASAMRYVFCPFAEMRTDAILNGIVPMGLITPISVQTQPVGSIYLAPLLDVDPNREAEFYAYDEKNVRIPGIGHIEVKPSVIVDELTTRYANFGCIQIKNLFSLPVSEWASLGLNELIFGEYFDEYSQEMRIMQHLTAESYLNQFTLAEETLTLRKDGKGPKLIAVLQELKASVMNTVVWARREAEAANTMLGTKDLPRFSPFHYRLFEFSGVTPRDEAVNQMAKDQQSLSQQLPELIESLVENNRGTSGDEIAAGIVQGLTPLLQQLNATVEKVAKVATPNSKKPTTTDA